MICVMAAVMLPAGLALGAGTAPGAGTKPAPTEYGELLEQAKGCVQSGMWGPFMEEVNRRTTARFAQAKDKVPTEAIRDLFYFQNVGTMFSKATGAEEKEMLGWLMDHRGICGRFLHALDEHDDLTAALGILKRLRDEDPELFVRNSEMCIAYAVVWDNFRPQRYWKRPEIEPDTMMNTYRYFNRNAKMMQIPPGTLPWELAVYVVDLSVTTDERTWALANYANQRDIGRLFFKVPYTMKLSPAHGNGVDIPYTLQNILQIGGVCMEQAHFASSVGKCVGVPSAYCYGAGKRGGHAWVSFLRMDKQPVRWDLDSGRYSYDHYYKGLTLDPTNWGYQNSIPLSELQMSAAILTAGSAQKLEDSRYCDDAARWLGTYAKEEWSGQAAYELLQRSLGICAYNGETWLTLAELAEGGKLTEQQTGQSVDLLFKYTLNDFPDFTEMCLERFVGSVKDNQRKAAILARAFALFRARPDLASEIKVAEGDVLLAQGKVKEAVVAYCWPLAEFPEEGHATGAVEERIEKLGEHVPDKAQLAEVYKSLLNSIVKNSGNTSEGLTNIFRALSEKLVALYKETGREKEAASLAKFADAWLASRPVKAN